ncbi:CRISPR-associated endonuclease Cas1 [Streptomyces luteireticuli]
MVADGYGVTLRVERGHLIVSDGLGRHRRERRIPRVERTTRRVVVMADTGYVTLEAARWCADTHVTIVQVDRNGRLVTTTGADHATADARLRRAQAFAGEGGPHADTGLSIVKALLAVKLEGQAANAEQLLNQSDAARAIRACAQQADDAPSVLVARGREGAAAAAYWQAWADARVTPRFDPAELFKLPAHWTSGFTDRTSLVNATARKATDPVNALLNYAYRLAEIECRLACLSLGLDPTMGFLHLDEAGRDSLALDLLETVRPNVDRYVLAVLGVTARLATDTGYVPATWFHETPEGVCRLVAPLTHLTAEQTAAWARTAAPHALTIARTVARVGKGQITTGPRATPRTAPTRQTPTDEHALRERQNATEHVLPDALWATVAPLLPKRPPQRNIGRKPADDRATLAGIIHVQLLGSLWTRIPAALGVSRRTCRARLDLWEADGTWDKVRPILEASPHIRRLIDTAPAPTR